MNVDAFIQEIGGRAAVIKETGLTKGRISQWCKSNQMPRPWVKFFLEKHPDACLKHGVELPGEVAA